MAFGVAGRHLVFIGKNPQGSDDWETRAYAAARNAAAAVASDKPAPAGSWKLAVMGLGVIASLLTVFWLTHGGIGYP